MKKIFVFLAISVFLFSSAFAGVVNISNPAMSADESTDAMQETMKFSFSDVTVSGSEYERIASDGCYFTYKASYPIMPYKSETLVFPFGTKIEGIDVKISDVQTMHLDKKITPAPEPVPSNMQNVKVERTEGEVYESNEMYPSNWATYNIGAGIENGEHVIFLSIHAFPAR